MKASSKVLVLLAWLALGICLSGNAFGDAAKTVPVTGKVLLPDGSPAVGAKVTTLWRTPQIAATSDASGTFTMNLSPGDYSLRAIAGNYTQIKGDDQIKVKADGSVSRGLELHLTEGCVIRGRLIDKTKGRPVSGARISTELADETTTNSDGRFVLQGVLRMTQRLFAVKEGYYLPALDLDTSFQSSVDITIETKPDGTIIGRVTDDKGHPLSDVMVSSARAGSIKTNKDGLYLIRGLDPDGRISVVAIAQGYEWGEKNDAIFPASQRTITVDFRLKPSGGRFRSVSGTVLTEDLVAFPSEPMDRDYEDFW